MLDFSYAEFGNERNRTPEQVWRYLTVDPHGNLTAEAIGARIPNLLKGTESVKKADLLFLLWYTCNLFWNWDNEDNFIELYDKISGFWELSIEVLDEAMLPNFYIPHLLERCFLNSICSSKESHSPFEIYEGLCEFVLPEKQSRNREKKADAKSTKKSRALMEKQTEERYQSGNLDFENLEIDLTNHFSNHIMENGKYIFAQEGIYYLSDSKIALVDPDMKPILLYKNPKTGERFNINRSDYKDEDVMKKRFQFVYGLSLYMLEHAASKDLQRDFRINYQKNVSLSII